MYSPNRWSRGNWVRKLSRQQYKDIILQFKEAAEKSFGTPCTLILETRGGKNCKITTEDFRFLTPVIWKNMTGCEANIRPIDKSKAPENAYASAEFGKGWRIHMYIQPYDDELPGAMERRYVGRINRFLGQFKPAAPEVI